MDDWRYDSSFFTAKVDIDAVAALDRRLRFPNGLAGCWSVFCSNSTLSLSPWWSWVRSSKSIMTPISLCSGEASTATVNKKLWHKRCCKTYSLTSCDRCRWMERLFAPSIRCFWAECFHHGRKMRCWLRAQEFRGIKTSLNIWWCLIWSLRLWSCPSFGCLIGRCTSLRTSFVKFRVINL